MILRLERCVQEAVFFSIIFEFNLTNNAAALRTIAWIKVRIVHFVVSVILYIQIREFLGEDCSWVRDHLLVDEELLLEVTIPSIVRPLGSSRQCLHMVCTVIGDWLGKLERLKMQMSKSGRDGLVINELLNCSNYVTVLNCTWVARN